MNVKIAAMWVSVLIGGVCLAGDVTWTGGAGNSYLNDAANWGGAFPTSGSWAKLTTAVDTPLKLSVAQWADLELFSINQSNTFDLGAGTNFYLKSKFDLQSGSTLTISSGTFGIDPSSTSSDQRMFLGNSGGANKVVVDGADSYFCGGAGNSANRFISIGQNTGLNTFTVRNGGHLSGQVIMGNYASSKATTPLGTNELTVTGSSSYVMNESRDTYFGYMQSDNRVRITDHSTMTTAGFIYLGHYNTSADGLSTTRSSSGNELVVDDHSSLTSALDIIDGNCGDGNLFKVAGGSTATMRNLYIGYRRAQNDPLFPSPLTGNRVEVEGAGTVLTVNKVVVGYTNACNGTFEVKNGADVRFPANDEMFVGFGVCNAGISCTNAFRVGAGSTVNMEHQFGVTVGRYAGANRNEMVVEGDVVMTNNTAGKVWHVGREGSENLFAIRNGGTVTATNMTFWLGGHESGVGVGNRLEITGGSSLDLRVSGEFPAEFSGNTPRIYLGYYGATNSLTVDASTLIAPNHYIAMGASASAVGSRATISGGADVSVNRVIVGDRAPDAVLTVSNGLVKVETTLDGSYSTAAATGCKIVFAGSNSTIVAKKMFRPRYTTTVEVRPPADGKMASPLIKCQGVETPEGSTPTFRVTGGLSESVTLLETTYNAISDTEFNRMVFDLPSQVRLIRQQKKLILKPVRGFLVIFR